MKNKFILKKCEFIQSPNYDDRPKNIDAWEKAGGIGIVHTSAKNTINLLKELRNNN